MTQQTTGDPMDDVYEEEESSLVDAVQGFLDNRSKFGAYELSGFVNRAILNEGAEVIENKRRMESLVGLWEGEASAPTGRHEDPEAVAEELRSEMHGDYDRGRLAVANAVRLAQKSRKVLLEPATCKMVVDFDHDGSMSRWMDVDVPEMFGVNPDYDPAAGIRLQEMNANSQVDFSRPVADVRPQAEGRRPQQQQRSAQRSGQGAQRRSGEPTPIRAALLEEIAKMRERQGFQPGDDPHQFD